MKLSVIIVNYNVKYFIEQCLHSVLKAIKNIEAEVIVVDNNSVDSSCVMIPERFPSVKLIKNNANFGFSKANNQGIKQSTGEYILLLNPDTIVQEDSFIKCIGFLDQHPEAGALGVKMIDGKGNFLPESKRALPTPLVAFYKIFGFSAFFPKSKIFGHYHLGYLDKNETHEVEVLSGAFMFIRKSALEKVGLLDEAFFMYGEDIDLSYRINKAGYKNYYFAGTTIIHYKGESTKKGSLNYVAAFYNAMLIFAEKHYSKKNFRVLSFLIRPAIYFRASISVIKRFIKKVYLPFIDILLIFGGYLFLKPWWESMTFRSGGSYPHAYLYAVVPAYISIWILSLIFSGTYDRPVKINNILKGIGIGTLIILAVYALLPLGLRFSRVLIILGAIWSIFSLSGFRFILHILNIKSFKLGNLQKKRIIIVGESQEATRVSQLLIQTQINPEILGYISKEPTGLPDNIGRLDQLEDIINIYQADEIIFCAKNITVQEIIENMLNLTHIDIEYKIAPPESLSIIGSNSINTAGDLYLIDLNTIGKSSNRREKRFFDLIMSFILLILYPFLFLFIKNRINAFGNIIKVLFGYNSWVGYFIYDEFSNEDLPKIKKGILNPTDGLEKKNIPFELKEKLNFVYAKDYKFSNDLNILFRGLLYIGR